MFRARRTLWTAATAAAAAGAGCANLEGIAGYHDQTDASAGDGSGSDDAAAIPPSCAPTGPGMTTCGSDAHENCCTSLLVDGGTYDRTYTSDDGGDGSATGEADPASVSSFRLDTYEVTVGRFRQFVSAWNGGTWKTVVTPGSGKHTHVNGGKGLIDSSQAGGYELGWVPADDANVSPTDMNLQCSFVWTTMAGVNESLPMNCVNWAEAYAFCIWDGGFLPSEAEWGYAAAGGAQQRDYPWGAAPPGTTNEYAIYGCYYASPPSCSGMCGAAPCGNAFTAAPVGTATMGAGQWGQLDLAGNVFEWTLDWNADYVTPCSDCAFLPPMVPTGSNRMRRGGSYFRPAPAILSTNRDNLDPTARDAEGGFRCARTP